MADWNVHTSDKLSTGLLSTVKHEARFAFCGTRTWCTEPRAQLRKQVLLPLKWTDVDSRDSWTVELLCPLIPSSSGREPGLLPTYVRPSICWLSSRVQGHQQGRGLARQSN